VTPPFLSLDGTLHVLPARRGEEQGAFLWVDAGERHERLQAEMYLPLVAADALDSSMGLATAVIHTEGGDETGEVHVSFGRVRDGRGIASLSGAGIEADVRFRLSMQPPTGGYCRHCGSELDVQPVEVITPPDGGVMPLPSARCPECG
jgi:hypothetical protein